MSSINDLPSEILVNIFKFYIKIEKQSNLLKTISNVCLRWRKLSLETSLWSIVDGSVPLKTIINLSQKGCFISTKNFKFSDNKFHTELITDDNAKKLFCQLKNVETIDFSYVTDISQAILSELGENCKKVCDIKFGCELRDRKSLNYNYLVPYLSLTGFNLLSIDLSYCIVQDLTRVLRCTADCCPNLEELYLIFVRTKNPFFPTDYIQKKCKKLKTLYLDHVVDLPSKQHEEGFPNLVVFKFQNQFSFSTFDDKLNSILFKSLYLESLDITYCKITTTFLCSLPATNLLKLRISMTRACHSNDLQRVLKKWSHSLQDVDLSLSSSESLDEDILCLISPTTSHLKKLNLSSTGIKAHTVDKILDKCGELQELHLEGCKNLSRSMRHFFHGRYQLNLLGDEVKSFLREN